MSDDRLVSILADLDRPAAPDPAYAERLYAELRAQVGFEPGAPAARWRRRLALGASTWVPVGRALRLVWIAAVVGLLAALAVSVALVGARRSAAQLVTLSQQVYADPPAFSMAVRFRDGSEARYLFDGTGTLRIEALKGSYMGEMPEGSYSLRDGERVATFDSLADTWQITGWSQSWPYPLFGLELDWTRREPVKTGQQLPLVGCDDWQLLPDGTVAGRDAFHVACGEEGYWIDADSLLLLRHDDAAGIAVAVTALEVASPPATAFAFEPPGGATVVGPDHSPPPSTVLTIGQAAPDWSGVTLDGSSFSLDSLRGRPAAVYFWADWCPPCLGEALDAFVSSAGQRGDAIGFASVALGPGSVEAVRSLVEKERAPFPVVVDAVGASGDSIVRTWGLSGVPALVLLDSDGRVAGVFLGPVGAEDLGHMLDALVAGRPIPTPSSPAPLATAGPN